MQKHDEQKDPSLPNAHYCNYVIGCKNKDNSVQTNMCKNNVKLTPGISFHRRNRRASDEEWHCQRESQ